MQLTLLWQGQTYQVSPTAIDLAIGLDFDGPQPSTYGVPPAWRAAFEGGGVIGDVRQGGSVNFETYHLTPHCNGTHTECVGHLTQQRLALHQLLPESWLMATLCTIMPVMASTTADTYDPPLVPDDQVITQQALMTACPQGLSTSALVLRTLPNLPDKRSRDYAQVAPAFFTLEAMQWLRDQGIRHLLVDLPSVDRLHDEGKLRNHRIFWGLAPGEQEVDPTDPPLGTITEMIYVPNDVSDGQYLLELQVAPFLSDAAPSRPRLFAMA
jgi:kynurenine formamidase